MTTRVSIIGASGYAGGELLRLLFDHPEVEVAQATSERFADSFIHFVHPNLRGRPKLQFCSLADLEPCDVLFLCLPHGQSMAGIERFAGLADRIVDLAADFRLSDPEIYARWYGKPHTAPDWLERFVYGLPELHRDKIRGAKYVSGVGCNATATNLAIWPLFAQGLADPSQPIVCELKVGSSEAGNRGSDASHHPERSHSVRSFAPTGHRHTGEVAQALASVGPVPEIGLSVTAIELVRGILATAHVRVREGIEERDLWKAWRSTWQDEPFVRIVKEKTGIYRYPEPKILAGSNFADVGFALDPNSRRVVAIAAIDNLMKGAAGTAVQCMNLMCGWDEATALGFPGLHPV